MFTHTDAKKKRSNMCAHEMGATSKQIVLVHKSSFKGCKMVRRDFYNGMGGDPP